MPLNKSTLTYVNCLFRAFGRYHFEASLKDFVTSRNKFITTDFVPFVQYDLLRAIGVDLQSIPIKAYLHSQNDIHIKALSSILLSFGEHTKGQRCLLSS